MTKLGKTYLVVTVGVGLGALNTGNNLLYLVLGLLLSLIVISGLLSERTLRHLEVRRIGTDGLFAGEATPFRWSVRARKSAAFALAIREAESTLVGEAKVAHLAAGEERVLRAEVTAPRRGPLTLTGIEVTTTFPLGLFAKSILFDEPGAVLVYPKRVTAPAGSLAACLPSPGVHAVDPRAGGEGDLAELVELREGEDVRRVHWKKSAALGKWVRAERERETEQTYVLRIASSAVSDLALLDLACERMAAEAQRLLRQGHAVGLEAGATRVRAASGAPQERRLLTALARVGYEGGGE